MGQNSLRYVHLAFFVGSRKKTWFCTSFRPTAFWKQYNLQVTVANPAHRCLPKMPTITLQTSARVEMDAEALHQCLHMKPSSTQENRRFANTMETMIQSTISSAVTVKQWHLSTSSTLQSICSLFLHYLTNNQPQQPNYLPLFPSRKSAAERGQRQYENKENGCLKHTACTSILSIMKRRQRLLQNGAAFGFFNDATISWAVLQKQPWMTRMLAGQKTCFGQDRSQVIVYW